MENKKYTIEEYARKILADHDCDEYTYGGEYSKHVLDDLKEAYPNGMEFPYVDVANAILAISKVRPIVRAPYRMNWSNDSCCDAIDYESFGAAKCAAEDTLAEWMCQERGEWKDFFNPTDEELDDYNYMIFNNSAGVAEYDPMTDEYEEIDGLSYEDEKNIGWRELTREDIAEEKAQYDAAIKILKGKE